MSKLTYQITVSMPFTFNSFMAEIKLGKCDFEQPGVNAPAFKSINSLTLNLRIIVLESNFF